MNIYDQNNFKKIHILLLKSITWFDSLTLLYMGRLGRPLLGCGVINQVWLLRKPARGIWLHGLAKHARRSQSCWLIHHSDGLSVWKLSRELVQFTLFWASWESLVICLHSIWKSILWAVHSNSAGCAARFAYFVNGTIWWNLVHRVS